jgi:hypothetical protein
MERYYGTIDKSGKNVKLDIKDRLIDVTMGQETMTLTRAVMKKVKAHKLSSYGPRL